MDPGPRVSTNRALIISKNIKKSSTSSSADPLSSINFSFFSTQHKHKFWVILFCMPFISLNVSIKSPRSLDLVQELSLHTSLNTAHTGCKPSTFMSSSTHSFQVFFLLPLYLAPATSTFLQADTQSSTLFIIIIISALISPFLQNTNTSHQYSKNYTGFQSNKELITNSVFSHTKHLQINNQHIFTIVFHFLHILFLQDLLIHSFFPFHMFDHHLAKGLSLSSVHVSGIHSLLIPETRLLYQYSVPGSKHTSSKLLSLPRLFPISLDCLPGF